MTSADGRRRWPLLAALVGLDVVLFIVERRLAVFHALPWLVPDSVGYLQANVFRSPLYPAILRMVLMGSTSGTAPRYAALGVFQHVALIATGTTLAYRFGVAYGRPVLALALAVAVLANPQVVSYCFTVLPESLFMSVLMLHLTCVVMLAQRWNRGALVSSSLTAAFLVLLKPAGYAMVAGLAVIAWGWRHQWRDFGWLAGPAVALLGGASAGNYIAHGIFSTEAQGGYARVAYVGHLLDDSTPSEYPALTQRIARQAAPIRPALASLPTIQLQYLIGANEYHVVESIVFREMASEIERQRGVTIDRNTMLPSNPAVVLDLDRMGRSIANAAIRAHPLDYLHLIESGLYGLWWLPLIQRSSALPSLQAEIDAEVARRPALHPTPIAFRPLSWPAFFLIRLVLLAIFLSSLAGVWLLWSAQTSRRAVGYVAILLHGYFLLVSLAQPGLPRYAIAVWPASMLLLFAAAALACSLFSGRATRHVALV